MVKDPGNSRYVKKMNRMTVLNIIREQEPVSRRQLAGLTGLTPPAITGIIRKLLDLGLVSEQGLGPSEGGRKPVKLRFNPAAGHVFGVEVTRHETTIGMADLKNHPTGIHRVKIDMSDPEEGLHRLITTLQSLRDKGRDNFLGLGVAFPGLVNTRGGTVRRSVNLGPLWDGVPLRFMLERGLDLPVVIENNSNASALAERWFGGGLESPDLVYINLGEGISAGVILDDRILQGFGGHAGEIGHIVVEENGLRCNCGNLGCLEALCGLPALLRRAGERTGTGTVTLEELVRSCRTPESPTWELMQETGRQLGKVLADVINLYNPQTVFIGGKLASAVPCFMAEMERTARSHAFPEVARDTGIKISLLGEDAGVIGACALALRRLMNSPQSVLMADGSANGNEWGGA